MASISEDTGEETPLQVFYLSTIFVELHPLRVIFIFEEIVIGTPKWGCDFHRYGWTFSGCLCFGCPFGQVSQSTDLSLSLSLILIYCGWPHKFKLSRYFTGHTKDTMGNAQFKAGKTKLGDAIDGAIKIVTIAVCFFSHV